MLSPKAIEVLEQWKKRHTVRSVPVELSLQEIAEVHDAQRRQDARSHAVWAASRLVSLLKRCDQDAYTHLVGADLWATRMLQRKYLVQAELVSEAYQHALTLASKTSRSVN